jgi:tetratricopeptide (TPR) repeat protein/predicted Ser/Thr protein kinase
MIAAVTGQVVSHYRVGERLGGGGMGEVYLAEDTRLGRQVALKFLSPTLASDPEGRSRLLNEARAASALRSPGIAVTYDIGEHKGAAFIVMEYVSGELLSARLAKGSFEPPAALDIAAQVADALDEAHSHGIVHRDIKSANLMLDDRGRVKVLDFGLARFLESRDSSKSSTTMARVTMPGVVLGTVSYMSPEQALGRPVDHRADLFSLGVVLYEMLTGRLPFQGTSVTEIVDRVLHFDPPVPSRLSGPVTPDIDAIVKRALEKDPALRYQSARSLADDARAAVERARLPLNRTGRTVPGIGRGLPVPALASSRAEQAVAVMTFSNITREAADDWIGTGIAETVTADLKKIQGLSVIGRARVFEALKNLSSGELARLDDRLAIDVGRRLGATWVVAGGYQRLGDLVRITAQFMDVGTGGLVRTVKVDGKIGEIFDLQDRIVYELSQNLNLTLGIGEIEGIGRDETPSMEAYEAYSRGVMNLRMAGRESLDRAIAFFERALTHDPNYASAYAGLGAAYDLKGSFLTLPDLIVKAIEALRKAIELNPKLSNAYSWLGSALGDLGRFDEAITAYEEALRLEPDDDGARSGLARLYWIHLGRINDAITEFERVIDLNPEAGYSYLQLAFLYALRGRYADAEKISRQAVDLQERYVSGSEGLQVVGAHSRLGYVMYLQGRYDEAIREYERELAFVSSSDHALRDRATIEVTQKLGAAWFRKGNQVEAERYFDLSLRGFKNRVAKGADDPFTRYYIACLYALRGDADKAFDSLERSFRELGPINRVRAPIDPDLETLRGDSRFQALLA